MLPIKDTFKVKHRIQILGSLWPPVLLSARNLTLEPPSIDIDEQECWTEVDKMIGLFKSMQGKNLED